jgi:hypothetical protein
MGESHALARRATVGPSETRPHVTSTKGSRRRNAVANGWEESSDSEETDEDGDGKKKRKNHFELVERATTGPTDSVFFSISDSLLPPIARGAQVYEQDASEFSEGSRKYPPHIASKKLAERRAKMKDIIDLSSDSTIKDKDTNSVDDSSGDSSEIAPEESSRNITKLNEDEPTNIFAALFWGSWS